MLTNEEKIWVVVFAWLLGFVFQRIWQLSVPYSFIYPTVFAGMIAAGIFTRDEAAVAFGRCMDKFEPIYEHEICMAP